MIESLPFIIKLAFYGSFFYLLLDDFLDYLQWKVAQWDALEKRERFLKEKHAKDVRFKKMLEKNALPSSSFRKKNVSKIEKSK